MAIKEIIETLVTVFKVEAEGVKQGVDNVQRDVNRGEKALNRMGDSAKKTSQQVTGLAGDLKKVSSAIQLVATTMGLFHVMNQNMNMQNISRQTGQAASSVASLERAYKKAGLSATEAGAASRKFTDAIGAAMFSGDYSGLDGARRLGADVFDQNGKIRDSADIMADMADNARRWSKSDAELFQILKHQGGFSDTDATFFSRPDARNLIEEARREEAANAPRRKQIEELNKLYQDQKLIVEDLGLAVLNNLAPTIKDLGEGIKGVTSYLKENNEALDAGVKGWVAYKLMGINPVIGGLVALGMILMKTKSMLEESDNDISRVKAVKKRMLAGDAETGASVAEEYAPAEDEVAMDNQFTRLLDQLSEKVTGRKPVGIPLKGRTGSGAGVLNAREKALKNLLFKGEAGSDGYNAVNRGERYGYKSGRENLEEMTIAEVLEAQRSGRFNAAGAYQMIPTTLQGAAKSAGISLSRKFDAETQDRLFKHLANKRAGDFLRGKSNDITRAQRLLSPEWAGLTNPDTGKSYWHGTANNKATITSAQFIEAMRYADMRTKESGSSGSKIENVNIYAGNADAKDVGNVVMDLAAGGRSAYKFNSGRDS
ncbi:hypothetical protein NB640_06295 [Oxalobacter vibrioformis]|uniref:Phage tail lysozyme domain-containing protein n=1 Tax=Oxalobacter vibrioformis TaxID=933080 RepID=A0A9E9P4G2_9BURK|nr:hypothetical protein [Oxalobacter vibrioformis]WAW11235.1 hypothetical protein NB640_06295 [Oxalobacter vibrioformis]